MFSISVIFPTPTVLASKDPLSISGHQVLVGCARAKLLITTFSGDVESATPDALDRLLAWKDRRIHHETEEESSAQYRSYRPVLADSFERKMDVENDNKNNDVDVDMDKDGTDDENENEFD